MSLTVWWATELYPDNHEESIGIAGDFPVIRLDDLREVMEGLKVTDEKLLWALEYLGPTDTNAEAYVKAATEHMIFIRQLLAQLKGVGGE